MTGDLIVYLTDGRQIDVSDMTAGEVIAKLRELGVTPADVDRTVHRVHGLRVLPKVSR
jgi:hypothetical protein